MTELERLEYRIKELEEALGELWFTCGKFWDGDDSIEKLLRQAQLEKNVADTKTAFDYAFDAENVAHAALIKARDELGEYLKEQDND